MAEPVHLVLERDVGVDDAEEFFGLARLAIVEEPIDLDEWANFHEAVGGLSSEEREAFSLVRIQGMTQSEAAEILRVSTKTVQRRLNLSLLLLREALADLRSDGMLATNSVGETSS